MAELSRSPPAAGPSQDGGNSPEDPDVKTCVICLDESTDPCVAVPCQHSHFHFLCLATWLQNQETCPLCKAKVTQLRHSNDDDDEVTFDVSQLKPYDVRPTPSADDGLSRLRTTIHRSSIADPLVRRFYQGGPEPVVGNLGVGQLQLRNRHLVSTGHLQWCDEPPLPEDPLVRRRQVYRERLYSLHIGTNRHSRYRSPPTAAQFSSTPHLVTRARQWIRRELSVFPFLSSEPPSPSAPSSSSDSQSSASVRRRCDNAEFLLEYIIAILKTVDIQESSGQARDMLSDYLGSEEAQLFLHELRSWLRSPALTLAAWDREVQYPLPRRRKRYSEHERPEHGDAERPEVERKRPGRDSGSFGGFSWTDKSGDHWKRGKESHFEARKRRYKELLRREARDGYKRG